MLTPKCDECRVRPAIIKLVTARILGRVKKARWLCAGCGGMEPSR